MLAAKTLQAATYFEVRLNSLLPKQPLPCDVYLMVNEKPTLFRKRGDLISPERAQALSAKGALKVLIPEEQRALFMGNVKALLNESGSDVETKGAVLKDAAFVQMQELFTNPNVKEVVEGTERLVGDMVAFLASSGSAAAALLKLSAHDQYTFNHSVNVAVYAVLLTKKLNGIDPNALAAAGLAALLHDIGKRNLPPELLNKRTPLSEPEKAVMRQHPGEGKKVLEKLYVAPRVKEAVYQHHENYDGSGFPDGLKGEGISQLSRVLAIADSFDALTVERPGQRSFSPEEALDLMAGLQPGRFDPSLFKHFGAVGTRRVAFTLAKDFDPCSPSPLPLLPRK